MTSTTKFLVAKYTPDLRRMEPRNFGVIVWSNGQVAARFAGEPNREKATIKPPANLHVNSRVAYRKWIRYWRELMSRPEIRSAKGDFVSRDSDTFVAALQDKSKPQYKLVRGGEFLRVVSGHLNDVVDELFDEIVGQSRASTISPSADASRLLKSTGRKVLAASYLAGRQGFRGNGFPWVCPVGSEKVPFTFDGAIHNGLAPSALFDMVQLWKPDDVYATAYEFGAMQKAYSSLDLKKCVAMVYPTNDKDTGKTQTSLANVLRNYCTVVDLRDFDDAVASLNAVAI